MAGKQLGHHSLARSGFSSDKTQIIQLDVDRSDPRKLKFKYATVTRQGNANTILPDFNEMLALPTTDLLDIHIEERCFVQMWLSAQTIDWFWRPQDAITMAHPGVPFYTQLQYDVNGTWVENPGEQARSRGIRFGAQLRGGGPGPKDPFNLNVILDWGEAVLPMTIDPDIQNPRT
jgi:hypothetical protein